MATTMLPISQYAYIAIIAGIVSADIAADIAADIDAGGNGNDTIYIDNNAIMLIRNKSGFFVGFTQ